MKGQTCISRLWNSEKLKDGSGRAFGNERKTHGKCLKVKAAETFTIASASRCPTEPIIVFKAVGDALTFNAIRTVGNGSVHFLKGS